MHEDIKLKHEVKREVYKKEQYTTDYTDRHRLKK
jgi:hypothetical protein